MAGFNINIGANTFELTKSLSELRKHLADLKKQLETATDAATVTRLNQAITQTDRQIKSISGAQSIQAIGRDMKELPAGFNSASFAVGNFSRVVQDAPFALLSGNLMAVSNNIDPLISSFVQLKQQSGSAGAAFKALGSSLIGSGGLLLGFSLVNAALTYFSARSMYAKDKTKELSDTIRDSATVEREAAASMAGQIAQVSALARTVGDANKSYNERKRALEELRQINKNYFGDLQLEDAATGKLAATVNEYSKAIINAAIQKEFAQEIAKVAKAASDADADLAKSTTKVTNAEKALAKARAESRPTGREGVSGPGAFTEEAAAQDALTDAMVKQRDAREKVTDLLTEQAILTDRLNKAVSEGVKLKDLDTDKTKKETDALKLRIEALKQLQSDAGLTRAEQVLLVQLEVQLASRDAVKLGFTKQELQERIDGIIEKAFPVKTFEFKISPVIKIDRAKISSDIDISESLGLEEIDLSAWDELIEKIRKASKAKKELLDDEQERKYAEFVSGTLGPAFADLFENIATNGAGALEEFGQTVTGIIKRLIAAAAAAAILSAILSAIFPGAGKGVTGFKAIFGQLAGFKFAQGGIVTGPTMGLIGELNRPEAVIPLDRLPQILSQLGNNNEGGGTLTAHVSGDGLLFILNQAQRKQNRIF
jgi:hypothetical protein